MDYYFTYGLAIPLLASILLIIILYSQNKKSKKLVEKLIFEKHDLETLRKDEIKNYFKEEWEQEKQKIDNEIVNAKKQAELTIAVNDQIFHNKTMEIRSQLNELQIKLDEKEKRYNEVNQDLNLYREGKIKEIDGTAAEYEQRKRQAIDHAMEEHKLSLQQQSGQLQKELQEQEDKLKSEIETIKAELEAERSKRAAINEEIRRARVVEEQQDFYKIQFNEEDKNDVEILRSIAPRLRHPEAINKVIWSAYYQKPLAELRKRLLPNGDVSCVYKATRLKTGEIYIGQTTSFDKRLQEHTRSALGIGSLASSQLHRMMLEDGPENYLWQILEVVPKDKLRERESYYIDFYDSKTYGLNSVTGDKNK